MRQVTARDPCHAHGLPRNTEVSTELLPMWEVRRERKLGVCQSEGAETQ
jgi:hypothetical protein